jgi:predicted phage terminase large subunit-like protein
VIETILGKSAAILVVEAPPRHGKSELISKYLPAWYLGVFPRRHVMLAGYEATFARSWGRKARALLEEWGAAWFGVTVCDDARAAADWSIEHHGGGMVTAGVGGPMTGRGADLLIIDDPIKNAEEATSATMRDKHWDWWQSTASTRVEPGGCAIIIATRWHEEDLSGRLLAAAQTGAGAPVRRLRLPAMAEQADPLGRAPGQPLWPERWPLQQLELHRRALDEAWWQALYQQRPRAGSRALWPEVYFAPRIWARGPPERYARSALAIDPAGGVAEGDDSALVLVGLSGELVWVEAWLARVPPERTISHAVDLFLERRPDVVALETNAFQSLLAVELDRQCRERGLPALPLLCVRNSVPKELRIQRLGPYLARGKLRFVDSPGCRALVRSMREFPVAPRDDGPDALEMGIRALVQLGRAATRQSAAHETGWLD